MPDQEVGQERVSVHEQGLAPEASQSIPVAAEPPAPPRESFLRRHSRAKWILLAGLLVLVGAGYWVWSHFYSGRESTDDAQIQGHVDPVSAKVGGPVARVYVNDNQQVKEGDVLVQIDPRDYNIALQRAKADLAVARSGAQAAQTGVPITATTTASKTGAAQAGVEAARANAHAAQKEVEVAKAQVEAARARVREAQAKYEWASRDLARMKQLIAKDEISQQQYDSAAASEAAARATLDAAKASLAQAEQAVAVAETHVAQAQAGIAQSEASLRAAQTAPQEIAASRAQAGQAGARIQQNEAAVAQAELNLAYTTVRAPVSGIVSNKTVELGQVIQPGQPLLAIIPLDDIWVVANFKETQLKNMRPGQFATIRVDAYGGREYRGHVDSIAAATGARFSVLPPENATGNYVKVVQRVPVKIVLEKGQDPNHLLRPGMSVEATVFTR